MSCVALSCSSSASEVSKDPLLGDLDLPLFDVASTTLALAYSSSFLLSCLKTSTPGPVTPVFWKCSVKLLPHGSCELELPPSGALGIRELLDTSSLGGDGRSGTIGLSGET